MELNKLSLTELRRLKQRVETEIKKRDDSAKRDLLKKMQRLAADHGMTLDEVVGKKAAGEPKTARRGRPAGAAGKAGRKTGKVAPKYRHPKWPISAGPVADASRCGFRTGSPRENRSTSC